MTDTTYTRLISLLDEHRASYRLIDHPPEGRTEIVSPMRGNATAHAAKCMVVMAKIGKKVTKYLLAVVPGDARVDLGAINAARLDRSVALSTEDYQRIAQPRLETIAVR